MIIGFQKKIDWGMCGWGDLNQKISGMSGFFLTLQGPLTILKDKLYVSHKYGSGA